MRNKKINLGDLIFILFYKFNGEIRGSTSLQKLIDIIRLDSELEIDVNYSPYDFGDFSPQSNDVVQVFVDNSWIAKEKVELGDDIFLDVYRLTENGWKIAKTIYQNLLSKELENFKILDNFKDKKQKEILAYSYFWFPITAMKSKIKDKIFKRTQIFTFLSGELEEEYNNIKSSGNSIKKVIYESWKC